MTIVTLLLIGGIGSIDLLTGYELSFSLFYLIPIVFATWYVGSPYSSPAFPFWNAAVRLGFFLFSTYLLLRVKTLLAMQVSLARFDGLTGTMNARAFKEASSAPSLWVTLTWMVSRRSMMGLATVSGIGYYKPWPTLSSCDYADQTSVHDSAETSFQFFFRTLN